MDLFKEIDDIRARKGNPTAVINNLEEKKNEIDKQIYIISVVSAACDIADMIQNKEFFKKNIHQMALSYNYDHDYGNQLQYVFSDKNGIELDKRTSKFNDLTDRVDEIFSSIDGFSYEQINDSFTDKYLTTLDLKTNFESEFINLMLSKELVSILEYGELQNSMTNNDKVLKKPKL